jgi:phasin family protein
MEIMQQAMAEMSEAMTVLSTAGAPQDRAAKQAELLRRAYERAVNNARELSEMIQRSNGEAVEILNRRFMEAMDEVRTAMERRAPEG